MRRYLNQLFLKYGYNKTLPKWSRPPKDYRLSSIDKLVLRIMGESL